MRLPIRKYGDPILRAKGQRIEAVDDEIRALADNMLETMHAANGIGLAAQQVGQALQLTVLDVTQVEDRPSTMTLNGEPVPDLALAMPLATELPVAAPLMERPNPNGAAWAARVVRSRRSRASETVTPSRVRMVLSFSTARETRFLAASSEMPNIPPTSARLLLS